MVLYPTYADGIKTKDDFMADAGKGVTQDEWELLLFSLDGTVEGWLQYYWIPQDHYLHLYACNINRGTKQALTELLALLKEHFPGYILYFRFPEPNIDAVNFLLKDGFKCIEENWDNSFIFDRFNLLPDDANIAGIDRWIILVYYNNGRPVATIFMQGSGDYYEIFGIETADGKY